ncbi:Uma2 family endonuclease [Streptomyces sp. NPDC006384]|uniref:Uma2 family endonuclease n=1 Tax=Streptomyces sp. NPDC006384 TaxID=3364745 RepID=UPI00368E5AC9
MPCQVKGRPRGDAYRQAGIPLYLLIDRHTCTVTVHSGPDRQAGGYRDVRVAKFGETVLLPDPVGIALGTEILENYVR